MNNISFAVTPYCLGIATDLTNYLLWKIKIVSYHEPFIMLKLINIRNIKYLKHSNIHFLKKCCIFNNYPYIKENTVLWFAIQLPHPRWVMCLNSGSVVEFCRTFGSRFSLDEMEAGSILEEFVVHYISSWLFSLTVDTCACFVLLPSFSILSQSVRNLHFFFQLPGPWNQKSRGRQLTPRTTHGVYEAKGIFNELKDRWPRVDKLVIATLIIKWKEANRLTFNERSAFQ